jgi:DNA modification methylase
LPTGYRTGLGRLLQGKVEDALDHDLRKVRGKVDLIFTSPPFPLNRKKKYGNLTGDDYIKWLASLAPRLTELLSPTGSIVIELGNAWEPGRPVMSLLSLRALMEFLDRGELSLCQEFVCHNPARLPSPAQWVNVERIRVKDSYTHVWWMAATDFPKANNRGVLTEYSPSMNKLLERKSYNSGKRPSGFDISPKAFLKDNGGAIPPNVINVEEAAAESLLVLSNTTSTDPYSVYCRENGLTAHPARMPAGLPRFFINFLTEPGDLVLDPFGGSNMTGAVAEELKRKWITIEPETDYVEGSRGRFQGLIIE